MEAKKRKSVTRKSPQKTGLPRCPKLLDRAMKLIDKVPPEREWPTLEAIELEAEREAVSMTDVIQSRFPELPVARWRQNYTAVKEYGYLVDVRDALSAIAHGSWWWGRRSDWVPIHAHPGWPKITAQLGVDVDTFQITLNTPSNPLVSTLRGVDVRYVRACAICGRVFWAKREKSVTCGSRCDATRRQRLRRAEKRQDAGSSQKKGHTEKKQKAEK